MRLVFAGNNEEFLNFRSKLWEKDKNVSNLVYLRNSEMLRGLDRSTDVLKVGTFRQRDDYDEVQAELNARAMGRYREGRNITTRPVTGNEPLFTAPVSGSYWFPNMVEHDSSSPEANENLIEDIINRLQDERANGARPDRLIMSPRQYNALSSLMEERYDTREPSSFHGLNIIVNPDLAPNDFYLDRQPPPMPSIGGEMIMNAEQQRRIMEYLDED